MFKYIRPSQQDFIQTHGTNFGFVPTEAMDDLPDEEGDENVLKKEEMLRTLTNCGLSEYESKAYSALVFLGPSKAGTISKESEVPQSKIYEILEGLAEKRLVEVFDGRPKEFKASDPKTSIKKLLQAEKDRIDGLGNKIDEISDFLRPSKKEDVIGGVWTTKGEKFKEFFGRAIEILERSDRYVYAISRDFSRSGTIGDTIKRCIRRGVKIRMIGMEKMEGATFFKAKWYHDKGVEIRHFDTKVHPRIVVADGKEVLIRLDYDTQKKDRFLFSSLWSEDRALVNVIDTYMKNMWKDATPIDFRKAA
jgi:HTH-type transcriptional regulator, sugar sensing transcriptional regulator